MAERTCDIDGCDRKHFGKGFCNLHYRRWRSTGDPNGLRKMPSHIRCAVSDCKREAMGRGFCSLHYQRLMNHGDPLRESRLSKTPEQRFLEKIDATGPCWEWTAGLFASGYGHFKVKGRDYVAHRWLWEHLVGPVPDELELDHLCRNRACVNPDHLEPVTHRENVMRSPIQRSAQNARKTHCKRGHELPDDRICRECGREKTRRHRLRKSGHVVAL